MPYCEDYPCCGHTPQDPCDAPPYDPRSDPHLLCDHNTGYCEVEEAEQDDDESDDEPLDELDTSGMEGVE